MNWGIVGLGKIAHKFVQDLELVDGANIIAAASRNSERGKDFARKHKIPRSYGSYSDLFQDNEVDIVYIATPHDSHAELCIEAMEAGKHVLCEKPLAVNSSQVKSIIQSAKDNQVFMMEALWSRFNPVIVDVLDRVKKGQIGEVNYVNADFTFSRNDPDDSRMMNMSLAGGSLLDMGIYPVFLSYIMLGVPEKIVALGRTHHTGADIQTAAIFKYKNGIANMMSGFRSKSDMRARICGTEGTIVIEPVWHESDRYVLTKNDQNELFINPPVGKGLTHEIKECMHCIDNGKLESEVWSQTDSLNLIGMLDEIRRQTDLKYPFE